jgi:hypothetical protein
MIHDTKETAELIHAGATLYKEIAALKEPSAFLLVLALTDDIPVLVSGLHGAHQVPAELADLTDKEAADLEKLLADKFHSYDNAAIGEAVRASARAVLAGVLAVRAWRVAMGKVNPVEQPVPAPYPELAAVEDEN